MDERHLDSLVRASVHYFNTDDEIGQLCSTVASIATTADRADSVD